jgi:hypothetical protein
MNTPSPAAPITDAQVVAYLREKCAELQRQAGDVYVSIEVGARRLVDGIEDCDWRAYIEGGESRAGATADEAITMTLAESGTEAKAARLRAEIAERQNELAKLEAGR